MVPSFVNIDFGKYNIFPQTWRDHVCHGESLSALHKFLFLRALEYYFLFIYKNIMIFEKNKIVVGSIWARCLSWVTFQMSTLDTKKSVRINMLGNINSSQVENVLYLDTWCFMQKYTNLTHILVEFENIYSNTLLTRYFAPPRICCICPFTPARDMKHLGDCIVHKSPGNCIAVFNKCQPSFSQLLIQYELNITFLDT